MPGPAWSVAIGMLGRCGGTVKYSTIHDKVGSGKVAHVLSKILNKTVAAYKRTVKQRYVYKLYQTKRNESRCCRCKEFRKYRAIRNTGRFVSRHARHEAT